AKRERSGHSPAFPESCFFCPRVSSTPARGCALICFYIVFEAFKTKKNISKINRTIPLCFVINPNRKQDLSIIKKNHPTKNIP
ncbi:hypothetical protein, partial [Enterobacter intestinihominis]